MPYQQEFSRTICISTNTSCNLRCIYCYEKDKGRGSFDVEETICIVRKMLVSKTSLGTKIKFHGGEPFLAFDKIRHLCESIWDEEYPEHYSFHITTNGTLIHGTIQDWLYAHRSQVILKLSLDGAKESNDINRPDSFDKIDIPFFLRAWPEIQVNMTITPQTIPQLSENVIFLHSQGFRNLNANFALMSDWSSDNQERTYWEQLQELVRFYRNNPDIKPFNLFLADIGRTITKGTFYSPCNIGHKIAFDFETRKYYPCHMFFPSVCGHMIDDAVLDRDFTKSDGLIPASCVNCPFVHICRTCYAENFIVRGSLAARDMDVCPYQKLTFAALFEYEYARILGIDNPSTQDVRKMMAIQRWQSEIAEIEGQMEEN